MRITTLLFRAIKIFSFLLLLQSSIMVLGQYVSPFVYENGTFRNKTRPEISREEANNSKKQTATKEFVKTKNGRDVAGDLWIDGYCRYRQPASYNKSRYNENVSEAEYCRAVFPADTVRFSDSFNGNGNIPWAENAWFSNEKGTRQLQQRITNSLKDGIPFPLYDSLQKMSAYDNSTTAGYNKGRTYEFSKAVKIWVKRMAGPDKMYLKLATEFPFTNGEDYTYFEVNDNGQYKISAHCHNCKNTFDEVEKGKSKVWREGDWNEITVSKDEFNIVSYYINEVRVFQYRIPDIPIAIRFAQFTLSMPHEWEKKKLMYHVGQVTVESYPKEK